MSQIHKNKKAPNLVARLTTGVLLLGLAIVLPTLLNKGKQTQIALQTQEMGTAGAFIYRLLTSLVGGNGFLLACLMIIFSALCFFPRLNATKMTVFSILGVYSVLLGFSHLNISLEDAFSSGFKGEGGGLIGAMLSYTLVKLLGVSIAKITFVFFIIILVITATNGKIFVWVREKFNNTQPFIKKFDNEIKQFLFDGDKKEKKLSSVQGELKNKEPFNPSKTIYEIVTEDEGVGATKNSTQVEFYDNLKDIKSIIINNEKLAKVEGYISETPYRSKTVELSNHIRYNFPPMDLLAKDEYTASISEKEVENNSSILLDTLKNFGVDGTISGVRVGPSITEYEFQPAPGIKISKILNLSDDIAMNLASTDIRIQAPIPGKAAVGIEVPNKVKSSVRIRGLIESNIFTANQSSLTVALGKDIAGEVMIADLAAMPHLLIAGSTGSGKSVCLNSLIVSILYKSHPDEVKLLMIDPKMVELSSYNEIPHLICPVINDSKKATNALRWAVQEMEKRYALFAKFGVKDLDRYNKKIIEKIALEKTSKLEVLPKILIIIDELADLMMVAPSDIEDAICRLAQMARAAGMHLVIATQRPSVDVITGIIKANIPSRIAFSVSSQVDSRTILDVTGAEKLLGKGDMLYYPRGIPKPLRVQGCYVSDNEIESIVEFLKAQGKPLYNQNIEDYENDRFENNLTLSEDNIQKDDLIKDVMKLFIEQGQASISMVQRNFRIGYTRAARIIDYLADLGYIGPYEGSKPRKVNMTLGEYDEFFLKNTNKKDDV